MIVFFVLVVLSGVGSGEAATTPAFVPHSDCGTAAAACYGNQKVAIYAKLEIGDFASACQIFKSALICMENVGRCTDDVDYLAVRQGALNDLDGICGVDGSIQSCGTDVQPCFNEMISFISDAYVNNFSLACPIVAKFAKCVNAVTKGSDCSPNLYTRLKQLSQILDQESQVGGCDGQCVQGIAICTVNATTLPTDLDSLANHLGPYCTSTYKIYGCLKNLTTSPICTTSSYGAGGSSYLQILANNTLANIGEVCADATGARSACVNDLAQCTDELKSVKQGMSVNSQCKILSEFLECISRLPCSSALAPVVANLRQRMESDEIEMSCPSVGSCNERFAKCGFQDQGLENATEAEQDQICNKIKTGISCFDYVKNDPYCINEYNSFTTEEQDLRRLAGTCGALRLVPLSFSLFVIVVMAILKQFF